PKIASASLWPWTCAMPQSSRAIVTREASAFQRARSGGWAAAVRRKKSGTRTAAVRLRIRQSLLGFSPARKHLGCGALQQLIGVADAEVMAAVIFVELGPRDRRGHR